MVLLPWTRSVLKTPTRALSSVAALKKTPLFDFHVQRGGKMVEFAGYAMPVQYSAGVLQSHQHTRTLGRASLFDVSHMGQLRITGKDRVPFLESLVVADIESQQLGQAKLSLLTNDQGGIIDDCVISKYDDHLYVVVNAGNQDADWQKLTEAKAVFRGDVTLERLQNRALVALQGPGAVDVLANLLPNVDFVELGFMNGLQTALRLPTRDKSVDVVVTRSGYTGEDGFELSIPSDAAVDVATALVDDPRVLEAGLGARDSLRLEAGLCLHGHDITSETTPVEAALAWTISKRRREEGGFPGYERIINQLRNKTATVKRVGFSVQGAAARDGAVLYDADDVEVGKVTSGMFSPTLGHAIGMAYVNKSVGKVGSELFVKARKKTQRVTITKMPFVPARYYKKE